MRLDAAVEVFVEAFAFTRSFARPAEMIRAGAMLVVRDRDHAHPRARSQEVFVRGGRGAFTTRRIGLANVCK